MGLRSCLHTWRVVIAALLALWSSPMWSDAGESRQRELYSLNQGPQWDDAKRQTFYHQPHGTRLIPYSWFLALEQKAERKPFSDPDFLSMFGFLHDTAANKELNPEFLPIGFTKTPAKEGPDYLGFNCAFCHTGQINYTDPTTYQRYHVRIDGGPSMQFNARFLKQLMEAVKAVLEDQGKRSAFVTSVMGDPYYKTKTQEELLRDVRLWLVNMSQRARLDSLEWGFGRFDALGNGANLIFAGMYKDQPDNMRVANGPVSIPSIWGSTRYDRMQWNGSVQNFLARGIAEAMSAGAPPDLDLNELLQMEEAANTLHSPPWPEIFPPIDPKKQENGQRLYEHKCKSCHGDPRAAPPERVTIHTERVETIGTDPIAATNFHTRKVRVGNDTYISAAAAIKGMTDKLISAALSTRQIPTAGANENKWHHDAVYVARPLHGIWATPPYLHNGSVPNLYQLLSPVTERSKCFYVDNRQYDPVRVGFAMRRCDFQSRLDDPLSGFELDTVRPGNYNTGHEFAGDPGVVDKDRPAACDDPRAKPNGILGCELSSAERWQLIEYLKSLTFP